MKKVLLTTLKLLLSVGIIAGLFYYALRTPQGRRAFVEMLHQPKRWDILAAATVDHGGGDRLDLDPLVLPGPRLGRPLRMKDALRIGFVGYLFNLAPMGIVGGDVVKAVMLAWENPGCRGKSAASVIMDRAIGLYILFVVGAAGILLTGFYWRATAGSIHLVCQLTLAVTAVGAVVVGVMFATPVMDARWVRALTRLPKVGPAIDSLLTRLRMYRRDPGVLCLSSLMTVGVHCLLSISLYWMACGLPGNVRPLSDHFVIYPLSGVASTIPLSAGPFELVYVSLYSDVNAAHPIPESQALVIALVYRLITILLAVVGLFYYFGARGEIAAAEHEAEAEEHGGGRTEAEALV